MAIKRSLELVPRHIVHAQNLFDRAVDLLGTHAQLVAVFVEFLVHYSPERTYLAKHVWKAMKDTDSRECRNCHNFEFMDFGEQGRRAVKAHSEGLDAGKTCIDCHKGIAHELPDMHDVDPGSSIGDI